MAAYVLKREQWLARPVDQVFAFFADARNLAALTPPSMGLRIVNPESIVMRAGARIHYRLRWHGLPLRWLTEIQTWNPPTEFADVQLRGPYKLWRHTHSFQADEGGTRMRDVVHYALPLGPLGRFVHSWLVRAELNALFDYRAARVRAHFGPGTR
jgi:ligand-binding SRPBCC domain-containing protein